MFINPLMGILKASYKEFPMTIRIYTGKFKRRNISENRKYDAYNLSSNELFLYIFKPYCFLLLCG
jgi:hypothetical protein